VTVLSCSTQSYVYENRRLASNKLFERQKEISVISTSQYQWFSIFNAKTDKFLKSSVRISKQIFLLHTSPKWHSKRCSMLLRRNISDFVLSAPKTTSLKKKSFGLGNKFLLLLVVYTSQNGIKKKIRFSNQMKLFSKTCHFWRWKLDNQGWVFIKAKKSFKKVYISDYYPFCFCNNQSYYQSLW